MVRACVMPAPHVPVELRELREPELVADSALLDVELSEVCGTDVHLQDGRLAGVPYPIVPGHVTVGRLARIRGQLRDVQGREFREGDRVTFLDVHRTCHQCWHCLVAKASTRCPERKVYGITYGVSDGLTGGWAERVFLKPATRVIGLWDVDAERFMAGGCGLPTAIHAVERGEVGFGDTVLVLGAGPVGLSVVILALLRGAERVLAIGAPAARLQILRAAGAAETLDFTTCDEASRRDWVLERTGGRGADVTIEATGAPQAVAQAMRATRDAGKVVIAGQYTDHGEVAFNPHLDLNRKHLDVRGCWGSDFSHFWKAVRIMADPDKSARWSVLPLTRFPLAAINDALAQVRSGAASKALVTPR